MMPHPKILALTDLHLRAKGQTIIGLDPEKRLRAVLNHAMRDHSNADHMILMGDLTHSGRVEEYELLKELLCDCAVPVTFMLGNHDNREAFASVFGDAAKTPSGHYQHIHDLPKHRIITLDSLDPTAQPHHAGALCDARIAWLRAALDGANGRMPLVFIHHPPCDIGLPGMDAIKLNDGDTFLDILASTGAHLFCGHVHRTISGQARGVPFTIFKSPCHQAPLDLVSDDSTLSTPEPGAFGVVLLSPGGVIVHSEDVGLDAQVIAGADALPDTD